MRGNMKGKRDSSRVMNVTVEGWKREAIINPLTHSHHKYHKMFSKSSLFVQTRLEVSAISNDNGCLRAWP